MSGVKGTMAESNNPHGDVLNIAIIGAGFGGLGLAARLRQRGDNGFAIFEQAQDVGGVWRDNTYPGAACDVPSHLYSFSFAPNPDWQRVFSGQRDIHNYLRHCAEKYQLKAHIAFEHKVSAMRFCEREQVWCIDFEGRPSRYARTVVVAIGALNIPQYPAIDGLETFTGKLMHTAEWDADYSLAGKRVGVIGTGASAIQVIPSIQPEVASLSVFQRTPPWVLPKRDGRVSETARRRFRRFPLSQRLARLGQYTLMESVVPAFLWDSVLTRLGEAAGRRYLKRQVADPTLRAKLTPDYGMGCKRVLLSDDYYRALSRDNVEVLTAGITRIEGNAVVTADGERQELDALILATGFQVPVAGAPMPIIGVGGRRLNDDWASGSEAYKGMTVNGYPNLLYMMGPNTGPGNTSVIYYIESQIRYILQYLDQLQRLPGRALDLKKAVQDRFNERLQRRMANSIWTSGCNSWYLTESGKNTTLWPSFSWHYRLTTRRFRLGDYRVVSAAEAATAPATASETMTAPADPAPSAVNKGNEFA